MAPAWLSFLAIALVQLAFIARVILRPRREPASRIAWILVIAVFPFVGPLAYLLLGETSPGRKRVALGRQVLATIIGVRLLFLLKHHALSKNNRGQTAIFLHVPPVRYKIYTNIPMLFRVDG